MLSDAALPEYDTPAYNPLVIDHFEHPRNSGYFEAGENTIVGTAGDASQGTKFALSARIAGERIEAVRFQAYGCPHCVAAGSWLSERLLGATRADLQAWSWREADEALQVPASKRGRLLVLEDAVRALVAAWQVS